MNTAPPIPPRWVVDTNVLVSLYVFADPRHKFLRETWQRGTRLLVSSKPCFDEAVEVMARPNFKLNVETHAKAVAELEAELTWDFNLATSISLPAQLLPLPRCQDRDDQKFLQLAQAMQAEALITYDKLLLKCRKRAPFPILTPEQLRGRLPTVERQQQAFAA